MKEKWQDIYTEQQLRTIQKIEKEILIIFIKICEKLNIEYFIYGGTLLGQVKYGDMIPWDDDIDVALTRENYNRFLSEAPGLLPKEYVLQTPYNERKSPYSYAKIRKKNTIYIEKFHHKLDIEKGIYIDIYPVDNIPNDERLRKIQWKKAQFFCKLYFLRQCLHTDFSFSKGNTLNTIKMILAYYILRFLPQKFYVNCIDKAMTKYNNRKTERKACLFSPNYENIYIKLYPLLKRKIGTIDVMIPNCYEDHLIKRYGNYKQDLPNNKKIGHFPYKIEIPKEMIDKE